MATRNVSFAPHEFYHLYNRGTDKRVIFESPADYQRFQHQLYVANGTKAVSLKDIQKQHDDIYEYERGDCLVAIGAYCLMPNHFHLLLTPLVDSGVAKFMGKLTTGYSMYFNKRYDRTGRLFEGSYKSKHATTDEYLKYLYAYIHLNPLKVCQKAGEDPLTALQRYRYFSLPDYLGQSRSEAAILTPETFPEYFQTSADHINELQSWLSYEDDFTEGYPR